MSWLSLEPVTGWGGLEMQNIEKSGVWPRWEIRDTDEALKCDKIAN